MAQAIKKNAKYVYDLPYFERMELCRILDQNDKWEELGGIYMQFDMLTIQTLRREVLRGNSPADELLTKWGHQNHTILELFVLLSKMQHYQAMLIIKEFVDPEYHRLIHEGEQNLSRLYQSRCSKNAFPQTNDNCQAASVQPENSIIPLTQRTTVNDNLIPPRVCENSRVDTNRINQPGIQEEKILNNEVELKTGKQDHTNNNGSPSVLAKREENVMGNDGSNFLRPKLTRGGESTKDRNVSEISSIAESVGILPLIPFKELEIATNGWDQLSVLGKGGFGTVYKGIWKNTPVAIKRTKKNDTDENRTAQTQQLLGELKMLNSYRHDNILPLYGFSVGAEEPCLIYQYMPNGSVEDRLLCRQGTKPLTWYQRHNIAMGTARGLQFLHTIGEKPLIHGDIKSANILLDTNFEPKIGDFGLAREGPYSHYTHMKVSKVHGTRPYLPDEFLRHKKFSTKVDTHSFGIVLYELATGLRAYDDQRTHKFLKDMIENSTEQELALLMDIKCGPDEHQTFQNLILLGKSCTSRKPKERPEMVMVLQELNAKAVMVKVQNLMKHNIVSPINPFDMQVIQDHLSHPKRISPASSISAIHRAISPLQPPPETSRGVSPAAIENLPPPINNNYSFRSDPVRNDYHREQHSPYNPLLKNNNQFELDRKLEVLNHPKPINNAELRQMPPVISVSPPSLPEDSPERSKDISSEDYDSNQNNADFDYSYSSKFDNVLPLISELGIKRKNKEKNEEKSETNNEQVGEIQTSAKGKNLWILDGPS